VHNRWMNAGGARQACVLLLLVMLAGT
jgi:hypothetical protein